MDKEGPTILAFLSDRYVLKILAYTSGTSKSIPEISMGLQIPIASCYRKVKALEKLGLMRCVGTKLTQEGKRVKVYQSEVESIRMEMSGGKLRCVMKIRGGVKSYEARLIPTRR